MDTTINKNERSWGIELISLINEIANKNDLVIKRAGGENTISSRNKQMFPDVILYGDKCLSSIIQGWELKMPDVPITDETFVKDAQRKAIALGLSSCVIWNFTYVKFYIYDITKNTFEVAKQWENIQIKKRADVQTYYENWSKTLEDVIFTVNAYLVTADVKHISIGDVISQNAIDILINANKNIVADYLQDNGVKDTTINAWIDVWWEKMKNEYSLDEKDKYKAYAKTIILNWSYRIIFAHLIKRQQKEAFRVNQITFETTVEQANAIFKDITERCDFYNIFSGVKWNNILPQQTWDALVEFSLFLRENGIESIDQTILQNILEKSVNTSRRELHGQFTTPQILARLLVQITVRNWNLDCADPCCGTGTIASELLKQKRKTLESVLKSLNTVWASDKYSLPLQIANISMTTQESIDIPCNLFQTNALDLYAGKSIEITDPTNGKKLKHKIPLWGAICSNLPFVPFENISDDDKAFINKQIETSGLNNKADLYQHIAIHLSNMLRKDGYMGIITSNSWLGTMTGDLFYKAIIKRFDLKQVHISGAGRWFKNADIVTTLLILQKKQNNVKKHTNFYIWHKSLNEINEHEEYERIIVNSAILDFVQDSSVISLSGYSYQEIQDLRSMNVSYNALFHDIKWLLKIKSKLAPLKSIFKIRRGSRRGWDEMFFPKGKHNIEQDFIKPALYNAKKINSLITNPDSEAFCCGKPLKELEYKYPCAFSWIKKYEGQKNNVGKPLPEVLGVGHNLWYEMNLNEVAHLFTPMNPDRRLFFGKFNVPTFINQRLIGLEPIDNKKDIELCHALLNSILMKFFIEAVGFGRGLGVLDINKNSVSQCYMLNPGLLDDEKIQNIKDDFSNVLRKDIKAIEEEIYDKDWIKFNQTVLRAYGIEDYYDKICKSLLSLRSVRHTAKIK